MARLRNLCVYCGSSNSVDPEYLELAAELGRSAAAQGIGIVYGAGGVGLMGALANGALAAGGQVVGVIPEHIEQWELGHRGISEYIVVDNMHTRKTMMFERADAFCVLPGGIGTLEETFETLTWRQLGLHDKPIVMLNHDGFWQPLLELFTHMIEARFLRPPQERLFAVAATVPEVFELVAAAPEIEKPGDLSTV